MLDMAAEALFITFFAPLVIYCVQRRPQCLEEHL